MLNLSLVPFAFLMFLVNLSLVWCSSMFSPMAWLFYALWSDCRTNVSFVLHWMPYSWPCDWQATTLDSNTMHTRVTFVPRDLLLVQVCHLFINDIPLFYLNLPLR
jgi:hypothetical protein